MGTKNGNGTPTPPCDCIVRIGDGGWHVDGCYCGNVDDCAQAGYWCAEENLRRADKRTFRNRLCILRSIDRHEVPELSDRQWERLRKDPYLGYLRLDDAGEGAVFNAILKRGGDAISIGAVLQGDSKPVATGP